MDGQGARFYCFINEEVTLVSAVGANDICLYNLSFSSATDSYAS